MEPLRMSYPVFPLVLGTGLLLLVAGWDMAKRRIPNWANAALGIMGLGAQTLCHGGWALLGALGAALITLAVLWVPWTRKRLGGGDVKATLCASTWLGLAPLFKFYLVTAVVSGVVAVVCWLASSASVRREVALNLKLVALRVGMPDAPIRGGAGRVSVPFGAAAAAAAILSLWWR
jgi:Flp pilus assembly protein protease CpaA